MFSKFKGVFVFIVTIIAGTIVVLGGVAFFDFPRLKGLSNYVIYFEVALFLFLLLVPLLGRRWGNKEGKGS